MRSPAGAVAWEFRQRHRWGLTALAGYLAVLAIVKLLIAERGQPVRLDSPVSFALVVVVPVTATFTYLLAVFSFGLSGDLAARRSMYPARLFTLPVTTDALALWPMLYGAVAMLVLWLATRLLAIWPSGLEVPRLWPGLLAASLLAWTQALTWLPYGLAGLRVIAAVLCLCAIDTVVLLALHFNAREPVMLAITAPQLPLAYLVARFAVARARRGVVPDWRGAFARVAGAPQVAPRRRARFASPEGAQAWFEWKRHGRSLPALVAILLPFELALLFAGENSEPFVFTVLFGVLLTPPVLAAFAAATVARSGGSTRDAYGLTPFTATRPLTSPALVAAILKAAAWATAAAWLLVLVAVPAALAWSGTGTIVIERLRRIVAFIGAPRALVIALLVFGGLLASTWKQLVQSLYIGLTGREWAVKGSVFLALSVVAVLGPVAAWLADHADAQAALWNALPLILGVLVCLKLSTAAWVATRLHREGEGGRLLADRALVLGAAGWCAVVLALYGLFAWLFSAPFFPRYLLGLIAILMVPLARISAAPLALAWNRHR